jgi:type IV fimbrial biogenesis protein FimT
MARRSQRGFNLIELMVVIGIAAVLATVVVPNMQAFVRNNRLAAGSNDLLHGIALARSEAIKRQPLPGTSPLVTICATDTSSSVNCNNGAFSYWIVFADLNGNGIHDAGEPLLTRGGAHSTITTKNNNGGILCFNQTGFASLACGAQVPTNRVVLCDARGEVAVGADSTARAMIITPTGRARVTRLHAELVLALAALGTTCP